MKIQTLADILAENDLGKEKNSTAQAKARTVIPKENSVSRNKDFSSKRHVEKKPTTNANQPRPVDFKQQTPQHKKPNSTPKKINARPEPKALDIKAILQEARAEVGIMSDEATANTSHEHTSHEQTVQKEQSRPSDDNLDNIPDALKSYLRTDEERQAEKDAIKADSRLRWLAFYYLSVREHSAEELKQKLIAKDQDPAKIDELLAEFAEKGYQSDHRTAIMLIREGIRKKRGRRRIEQDFYAKKLNMPSNIDELIDLAVSEGTEFVDVVADGDSLVEGVDWLKLAVEARVKKYGDAIPTEQKEKARQLRFLQYRGFETSICFEALKHDLVSVDERF